MTRSRRATPRPHGTYACYVFGPGPGRGKGCRCSDCRRANSQGYQRLADGRRRPYRVRWRRPDTWEVREFDGHRDGPTVHRTLDREEAYRVRDELNGQEARPDPVWMSGQELRDVRAHIRRMVRAGLGLKGIANAAGVNPKTVTAIHLGRDPSPDRNRGQGYRVRRHRGGPYRVRRSTGGRILGVTLSDASDGHKVDAGPTWELLETLLRAGYPKAQIARALGRGRSLQIRRTLVFARTERQVHALYERLYRADPRVRLAAEGHVFRRRIRDRHGAHAWRGEEIVAEVRAAVELSRVRDRNRRDKRAERARRREEVVA